MLKFLSSMLCMCKMHPFSLGNYLGTSLKLGKLMIIRVTRLEWTMVRVRMACNTKDLWALISRVFENICICLEL